MARVSASDDNRPFSVDELTRIESTLDRLLSEFQEQQRLDQAQFSILQIGIEDMKRASTRIGRKDWMLLAIGTLLTIMVPAAFPPDVANAVFQTVMSGASWVISATPRALGAP